MPTILNPSIKSAYPAYYEYIVGIKSPEVSTIT
jgi:hypothetical protein